MDRDDAEMEGKLMRAKRARNASSTGMQRYVCVDVQDRRREPSRDRSPERREDSDRRERRGSRDNVSTFESLVIPGRYSCGHVRAVMTVLNDPSVIWWLRVRRYGGTLDDRVKCFWREYARHI
jgi:hypothetical protein